MLTVGLEIPLQPSFHKKETRSLFDFHKHTFMLISGTFWMRWIVLQNRRSHSSRVCTKFESKNCVIRLAVQHGLSDNRREAPPTWYLSLVLYTMSWILWIQIFLALSMWPYRSLARWKASDGGAYFSLERDLSYCDEHLMSSRFSIINEEF